MDLLEISERRRREALRVMREVGLVEAWESVGARVRLVGSVASGLMMNNLDIDLHVYTDEPMLEKSLAAVARLRGVRDVEFRDLLDTPEECLEWHAFYDDTGGAGVASAGADAVWRLDMIHIRRGSTFDGVIERTTDAIIARLDPAEVGARKAREAREAILRIKHDAPKPPAGIEVYYAVLELGLRTYDEFAAWKHANPSVDLLGWMPS